MKKLHINTILLGVSLLLSTMVLQAEGTTQVAPDTNSIVMLETNRAEFGNFAAYNGQDNSRLYIRIEDASEVVNLGLSVEFDDDGTPYANFGRAQYEFRIRRSNPMGFDETVHGPFIVRNNNNNVNYWSQSQPGSYPLTATQIPIGGTVQELMYVFQPTQAGDYYIEFKDVQLSDNDGEVNIGYWDITVRDNSNLAINGRVWSRNWAFRTPPIDPATLPECQWSQPFEGSFYTYTSDGFVSKIDFSDSGFQGLSFNVAFNSTGPGISGNLVADRMSSQGVNNTDNAAEHQIFLTPPDPAAYPSTPDNCGMLILPSSLFRCSANGFCIDVEVTKPGQVEVIIDFNQNGEFDPNSLDVSVLQEFPDSMLSNCIEWDGMRGDSTPVAFGDTVNLIFVYSQGIQHYSAYDVEFLKNGFCVETIRPNCSPALSSNKLYWDDSQITDEDPGTGQPKVQLNGCECAEDGCRTWNNFDVNDEDCIEIVDNNTSGYGDKNTLNTWWFANTRISTQANIPVIACAIEGPDTVCTDIPVSYTAMASGSTAPFTYQWTGPEGFMASTEVISGLSVAGEYCLTITGSLGCQTSCCRTLTIDDSAGPEISYPEVVNLCVGDSEILQSVGDTTGLTFSWSPTTGLSDPNVANPTVMVATNTEYTVTITPDNPFCEQVVTVSVEVIDEPVPAFTFLVDCDGITLSFTNNSLNADAYLWDFGDTTTTMDTSSAVNPTYTYPDLGTYSVSLTAINGGICEETLVLDVTLNVVELSADFTATYQSCSPDSVVVQFTDQSVSSSSPITNYDYQITPGNLSSSDPNPVFTFYTDQTITITYTITNADNCTTSITRTLDIFLGAPSDQFPDTLIVCPGVSTSLTPGGDSSFVYSWSPTTGLDNPNSPAPTFSPTATTLYTVTVSSIGADTCTLTETVLALVPPAINLSVSGDGVTCEPEATLTASADVAVTFAWTDGPSSPVYTVPVSGSMNYTVTATDQYGCSESVSVNVAGGPVMVSIPDTAAVCLGDEISLTVTNQDPNDTLTYAWTPTNLFVPGTEDDASPDYIETVGEETVFVTATNQFGCSQSDSVIVAVVDTNIMLSFTSEVQCDGATVEFTNTSTDAFGYLWFFGDGSSSTDANPIYTYAEAGTYSVTLTLVYDVDCADEFVADVTVQDPQVVADFTFEILDCSDDGALIQFTDNSTNTFNNTIGYAWSFMDAVPDTSNEQNPQVFAAPGDLIVTYTITTANDCEASFTDTIEIITTDIDLGDSVLVCPGESAILNPGGDTTLTYLWSPATGLNATDIASPTVTPLETSTYYVTVTGIGVNPCVSFDSIVVVVPEPIDPMLPDMVLACSGEPTPLNPDGNINWTYNWVPADNLDNPNSPNPIFTATGPAQVTYTVTVTDENGCDVVEDVVVNVTPDLMLMVNPVDTNLCSTAPLDLTASSPVAGVSYTWYEGDLSNQIGTGPMVSVMPMEGSNTYFVIGVDENGCADTLSTMATVQNLETGLPPDTVFVCEGVPTPLNPNGDPTLTYMWTPEDNLDLLTIGAHNPIVTVVEPAVYFVTIMDTVFMCTLLDTVYVEVYDDPTGEIITSDTILCESVPITLEAMGSATNFDWYDNPDCEGEPVATGANAEVTPPLGTSVYYLKLTNENDCEELVDSVQVDNYPLQVSITPPIVFCEPIESVTLEVTNGDPAQILTIVWEPLGVEPTTGPVVTADPNVTNTFTATVTNQFGCSTTLSTTVDVVDLADLTIMAVPDTITLGNSTLITVTGCPDCTYTWDVPNGDIDPEDGPVVTATPSEAGLLTYTVVAERLGCEVELSVTILVLEEICDTEHVFLPNAFTPNGDGANDVLQLRSAFIDDIIEMELLIYDRWGEEVFRTTDPSAFWDGTYRGERLPPDVYGFYLRVVCPDEQELIQKGNITILR